MFLFYARHGDPIYEPDSLTEFGSEQAEALSKRFLRYGLDKIYSSTSERAYLTAKPTADKLGLTVEKLDFANERHAWAEFTTISGDERKWCFFDPETVRLFKSDEIRELGRNWYKAEPFKNATYGKGVERVEGETIKLIESFGYEYNPEKRVYKAINPKYKRVALFAHGGFGAAFLSAITDIPYPMFSTSFAHLQTTGVCVIKIDDEGDEIKPIICQYSNDSHLYKEDLDRKFNGAETF